MSIILYGQYPRSEALVQATRDFDRQRISHDRLEEIRRKDREQLLNLQKGFSYLSPGLFHWDDLLRPFTQIVDNMRQGALTRFFETNTFWRLLELEGPFVRKHEALSDWIRQAFVPDHVFEGSLIFTLPFLFLFRDFSHGCSLEDIQNLLLDLTACIDRHFHGLIVFFEPTIGWRTISQEEKEAARTLIETIKERVTIPLVIAQCFFPIPHQELQFLYDLPVDGIGIDFYHNTIHDTLARFPQEKRLLAGILDTNSPLIEEKKKILDFLNSAQHYVAKEQIDLTLAGPAELLPRKAMDKKVNNLKEIINA
ncbi:MAG: hypothetical protein WB791_00525 [Waddliaceae bacterium]